MKTAHLNLRYTDDKRAAMFAKGIRKIGYDIQFGLPTSIVEGDLFITWNRIGAANIIAKEYKRIGNRVLVAENASWGNEFAGRKWYHIANELHNTAGKFNAPDEARFDLLGVNLKPFRTSGETVILPQRGIGSKPVTMPNWFVKAALQDHGGRVRKHPGMRDHFPLEDDLKLAGKVVTWGSGAAIKALTWGIPVMSYYPEWIAKQDNTEQSRLTMFRSLAWAQWTYSEIENGEAFQFLLNC